ncbi:MFS transporter [Algimonas porphyrae]|uniref:MFS transporter n=1 Tax=Algimonas porphyrae TaxID=1128113 RepID=A0ABQ5V750_9PROT|nr:MFS transporter [Algimonas porphyrae]GLQ22087.1 MFS transporter [Algimonas porphyrae]
MTVRSLSDTENLQKDTPYPSRIYSWGMVGLLWITYVSSFVDRYVFGLLASQIKADLSLTDTQIGLLGGLAFAVFYGTSAIFLGWLADHKKRTWIVGIGSLVWSIATTCSGLAKNYGQLFVARMGVGAGEATLSPCAMSMIADSFPPERRGKPIAVYTSALVIGAGFAGLLASAILTWTNTSPEIVLPIVGELKPWQLTFLIVGIPGVFLAIPFFFLPEPTRRSIAVAQGVGEGNILDTLRYMGRNFGTYGGLISLVCVMTICAYAQSTWLPSTFERSWGWEPAFYSFVKAIMLLTVSPPTILLTGWMADRMMGRGQMDAPFILLAIGALILIPTHSIAMIMPSPWLAFAMLGLNAIGIGMVSSVGVTALLQITPDKIRGQIVAIYYMAISMSGLLIGPVGVGFLSDNVFGEENLRFAMASLAPVVGVIPLALIPISKRLYVRKMNELRGLPA